MSDHVTRRGFNAGLGAVLLSPGLATHRAFAQGGAPIKIGLIMPYSGQFADTGAQIENGIKLYMKQHGDTVAGRKIEIIRKDVGGINPPVAKRLAQELVTRDNVDILAGFSLTPNALAAADISKEAKKFMVVMNAATSIITTKSPYMARVSLSRFRKIAKCLGDGRSRTEPRKSIRWFRITGLGSTRKRRSNAVSRRRAVKLSDRCESRSPIRISPRSCSAPRI